MKLTYVDHYEFVYVWVSVLVEPAVGERHFSVLSSSARWSSGFKTASSMTVRCLLSVRVEFWKDSIIVSIQSVSDEGVLRIVLLEVGKRSMVSLHKSAVIVVAQSSVGLIRIFHTDYPAIASQD